MSLVEAETCRRDAKDVKRLFVTDHTKCYIKYYIFSLLAGNTYNIKFLSVSVSSLTAHFVLHT
jgi:hypothetical protein